MGKVPLIVNYSSLLNCVKTRSEKTNNILKKNNKSIQFKDSLGIYLFIVTTG